MRIVINDVPLALGDTLPDDVRESAGLRRPGLVQRLRERDGGPGERLVAEDAEVLAFDGRFHLYPCTDGYLDRDRQWRTTVTVVVAGGRVRSILLRVIDGRYAASEFVDRFREVCTGEHGEGRALDRYTRHWRNGAASFVSCLEPDRRNASFVFEVVGG